MRLLCGFLLAAAAVAQPHISAVVSAADFAPGVTFGGLATIFGTGLSDASYQAQALPLPTKLGNTQIFVCYAAPVPTAQLANIVTFLGCAPTGLVYASATQVNLLLPNPLPAPTNIVAWSGYYIFVASAGGVLDQDALAGKSVQYSLANSQPRIFFEGYDCFIDSRYQDANENCGLSVTKPSTYAATRGAVTDQQGRVLSSSNPAHLGQYYTIWMTGLGVSSSGKVSGTIGFVISNIPVYGYPGDTWESITPSYVGPSPQYPGLDQVNFQFPLNIATSDPNWNGYLPPFPCGDYNWEVSLSLSGANLVQIPIVVKRGDVPCVN